MDRLTEQLEKAQYQYDNQDDEPTEYCVCGEKLKSGNKTGICKSCFDSEKY